MRSFYQSCLLLVVILLPASLLAQNTTKANFKGDPTSGCAALTVTFYDYSTNATSWTWTFTGGNPSAAKGQGPHTVVYSDPGSYTVSLSIVGQYGFDTETKNDYIQVEDCTPVADFTVTPTEGCAPLKVVYTDQSSYAETWSWSFPGGEPSSASTQGPHTVLYKDPGDYDATLVISNQYGKDGTTKENVVHVSICQYDFGDAPRSYGTLKSDGGPYHQIDPKMYLGKSVDAEDDGQPDDKALGDDNNGDDDEDGVTFLKPLVAGDATEVEVVASQSGMLKAWIDFNQNGAFDNDELVIDSQVASGSNNFAFDVPADAKEGKTFSRFRYGAETIKGPTGGPIFGGEINDFYMEIHIPNELDYGDAPDGSLAYLAEWTEFSDDDVIGHFPTCGYRVGINHGNIGERYFGDSVDYEAEGNGGDCSGSDGDELNALDGDAGIRGTKIYHIAQREAAAGSRPTWYIESAGGWQCSDDNFYTCEVAEWGQALDLLYHVDSDTGAFVNVLIDWNFNGGWNDGHGRDIRCPDTDPPVLTEYVLRDFYVPPGHGMLSALTPPDFRIGRQPGYVWMRCTITDVPINDENWTGDGVFADGETEDYLIYIADPTERRYRDWGDAPDGTVAYPGETPVTGTFPTCGAYGVRHGNETGQFWMFLGVTGCRPSIEPGGNRGYCTGLPNLDDDNGLLLIDSYTLEGPPGEERVVLKNSPARARYRSIGYASSLARWGKSLDLSWTNMEPEDAYVNVLIDWNQNGQWEPYEEQVLTNFPVWTGSAMGLFIPGGGRPPDFRIGPNPGYVWARFTITPEPIPMPWDGSGSFTDGETEDYLLKIDRRMFALDFGDAPWEYHTLTVDSGAVHRIRSGFSLGDLVSEDDEGRPGAKADADKGDDGVYWATPVKPGEQVEFKFLASTDGILNGWIDFDQDSSWEQAEDHVIRNVQLQRGSQTLFIPIPADAKLGTTFARFRFSDISDLPPYGPDLRNEQIDSTLIPIGEVEDYMIQIEKATGVAANHSAPAEFRLYQNSPNPFNPTTTIKFDVARPSLVQLTVYDMLGRQVVTLVNKKYQPGSYKTTFNAGRLASGIYFCRIRMGDFEQTHKMLLVR